jgi:flotillin
MQPNLVPMFADLNIMSGGIVIVIVLFLLLYMVFSRYTKVGPNQVLIVSGIKRKMVEADGSSRDVGFRVVKGRRRVRLADF